MNKRNVIQEVRNIMSGISGQSGVLLSKFTKNFVKCFLMYLSIGDMKSLVVVFMVICRTEITDIQTVQN